MPAPAPPVGDALAAKLLAFGQRIRAHRKALRISATVAAEAAGMSRVTLHRIERGEPSVTMGAYLSALSALGLELELVNPQEQRRVEPAAALPSRIHLSEYAQLKRLAWQLRDTTELAPREALDLYERNWRHVDQGAMDEHERALVKALVDQFGGGRLLV
jgi:transcriptional regulator with XRE-family HTH domain